MVIKYGIEDKYEEPSCCPVCNSGNEYSNEDYTEHVMMEVDTKCNKCGHQNHWAFGFFTERYTEVLDDKTKQEAKGTVRRHRNDEDSY